MTWWAWFFIIATFFGIIFFMFIWMAFVLFIRSVHSNPEFQGYTFDEQGKFDRHVISGNGLFGKGNDWKQKSFYRDRVKFNVMPKGIGKKEEKEWNDGDYLEFDHKDGGKKLILFGIKHIDKAVQRQLTLYKDMLNNEVAEKSLFQQKYYKLQNEFDRTLNEKIKQLKDYAPVVIKPNKK